MKTPPEASSPEQPLSAQERRRGEQLGKQLQQLYDEVVSEEVPDAFLRLLEEADKAQVSSDEPRA